MVVQPKVKGFMCTTAHPEGCKESVRRQIEYVKSQPKAEGPKKVLVLGASMGYGLELHLHMLVAQILSVLFLTSPVRRREQPAQAGTTQRRLSSLHRMMVIMRSQLMEMRILRRLKRRRSH